MSAQRLREYVREVDGEEQRAGDQDGNQFPLHKTVETSLSAAAAAAGNILPMYVHI